MSKKVLAKECVPGQIYKHSDKTVVGRYHVLEQCASVSSALKKSGAELSRFVHFVVELPGTNFEPKRFQGALVHENTKMITSE